MHRTKVAALAALTVLAVSALAAPGASALPEYGRCVAKSGGKYLDGNCTKAGKPGAYEFLKVLEHKGVASLGTTAGVLVTVGGSEVKCTGETSSGEYWGGSPTALTVTKGQHHVVVRFTGCELPLLGAKCNSKAAATGEIVTNGLEGKLSYVSKASKTVEQELKPEKTAPKKLFAEFECGGGAVVIETGQGTGKGGDCIYGPVTPTNVSSTEAAQTWSGAAGAQNPNKLEGSTKTCNLESRANAGAWERVTESLLTTLTSEEAVEIKA